MLDGSAWGLPAGTSLAMVAAVLIPVGIVTVVLRQLPFSLMRFVRSSELVDNFGRMMPVGVMFILVAYAVWGQKDAPGGLLAAFWPPPSPSRCTRGGAVRACPSSPAPPSTWCWSTSCSRRGAL